MTRALTRLLGWIGLLAAVLPAACSPPVEVHRVSLRSAYEEINRTALSSDEISEDSRTVLRRTALLEMFDSDPDQAIAALRARSPPAWPGRTSTHWRK